MQFGSSLWIGRTGSACGGLDSSSKVIYVFDA